MSKFDFKPVLAGYLKVKGYDVAEVTRYDQTEYNGYCETCSYGEIRINVEYTSTSGESLSYTFYGDMGELIAELESL